jgi:hypothetical protein
MNKENFIADVRTAFDVALLKHNVMHAVATDKKKNVSALLIIAIGALLSGLGLKLFGSFFAPSWLGVITMAVYQVISAVIGIIVISLVSKAVFKGAAKHDEFFRVLAFGMVVTWLSLIPAVGFIGGIWGLVILFSTLKVVHKLTTGGAIGAIIVSMVLMVIVNLILSPVLSTLGVGSPMGKMNFKGNGIDMVGDSNNKDFKMNIKTDDGTGSVNMENGKMVITGPNGEKMEVNIPQE